MKKKLLAALASLVCVAALAGCSSSPASTGEPASGRPNFVFVLTDDLSWNLVSHMPHVVALEQDGTTMSHYYVVDSLCCPSRTAIFTGEYPHDDGVYANVGTGGGYHAYNQHGDASRSFAVALQKAGYRTAMMGKYLNGYEPVDHAAPGWNVWDVGGEGYPEFNYNLNENDRRHHFGDAPGDYLTDVLSSKASAFISSAASSDKPFMLEVATFAPHAPYTPAPRYANAASTVAYPKTAAYDQLPVHPPSWLKNRAPLSAKERGIILTDYRERIEADLSVDDMIGRLEGELRAKGLARNTYFVFSSDNGYHMGEYRLHPGKQTAFDTDIHVPLIVTGPGIPADQVASQLTSNIDLCPTFETLAGVRVPSTVDGHSLARLWHGHDPRDWRQAVLIEHHGPDDNPGDPDRQSNASADPPSYEAVRTLTALYVQYSDGAEEYYNTAKDPDELDNIARDGIPEALRGALVAMENCHTGAPCWAASHLR